ncbi:MAG: hypothetical protein IJY78_03735 [Bacteroidaceae bacterium]|nr:hypothetical protein [Bacteroidaceae bacterium]
MIRNMKSALVAVAMLLPAVSATAQNTYSGYFTDGYMYRHQMNPAIANEQGYFAMPALGNMNFALRGNTALSDVLYNVNGKTTTFLNPGVSAAEFLDNINDKNKLGFDLKMQILSLGFKGFKGYNTFGINLRTNVGMMLPGELFRFAKEGVANKTYDISDMNVHADAYVEVALGHSHQINKNLRIGATLKFLVGGGNVDAKFNKAQLTLGENNWTAITDAEVQASVKGLTYMTERNSDTGHEYVNDLDVESPGPNGFGFAVDLGAEYRLNDDWKFSAALLDLGFINWKNNMVASTNGEKTFETNKYLFNIDDNEPNNFEDELDKMVNDLSRLYELENNGDAGSRSKMLGATLNLGAEYSLPAYRKLTFGLLNTTRFQGDFTWTEFRLSANCAPTNIFSVGVNVAAGTYGTAFGWMFNFHPDGFNLFFGMDRTIGELAKQGVPMSGNASFNIGLNFPF